MTDSISPPDPNVVAKATLDALGDLISACDAKNQPSEALLAHFHKLYLELKGTPDGVAAALAEIRDAQNEIRRHVGAIAQRGSAKPIDRWTGVA
jgi:hypothetical protein